MKSKLFLLSMVFVLLFSVFAFAGEFPRSETLYVNGLQWGPPSTWNPLAGRTDWPLSAGEGRILLYETQFMYNMLTGKLEPLIGKKYEWKNSLTMKVELRDDVHFQDGTPLTAEDVVYTLELAKKYDLSWSDLWQYIKEIKLDGKYGYTVKLKPENPNKLKVTDMLVSVYVLPKHIWEKIEKENNYDIKKIREFKNDKPVGSGPYKLYSYSPEKVALVRDDNYWGKVLFGKLPAPKYIVHPVFKSNDDGNLAFSKGEIDMSQQFVPQIWKMWEKGLPIETWYDHPPYYVPAMIPSLVINVHKHPLDIPEVRRALAYAINYPKIAQLAMTKYSPTVKASRILPFGGEKAFYDEKLVKEYGWSYNPKKAVEILESIGAKKGKDGIFVLKDGTRLGPFKVECPYGWTDWMVSLQIVAQSAKKVGIDIKTYFPDYPVYSTHRMTGDFDMLMSAPGSENLPSQPWTRFYASMYSKGVPEMGKNAFRNYGRYKNEKADSIIEKIPTISNKETLKFLYRELDKIFMQDIPIIGLEYRPAYFYEYNTTHWTNFPNAKNPYAPPQICSDGAGIRALYEIKPTGK